MQKGPSSCFLVLLGSFCKKKLVCFRNPLSPIWSLSLSHFPQIALTTSIIQQLHKQIDYILSPRFPSSVFTYHFSSITLSPDALVNRSYFHFESCERKPFVKF